MAESISCLFSLFCKNITFCCFCECTQIKENPFTVSNYVLLLSVRPKTYFPLSSFHCYEKKKKIQVNEPALSSNTNLKCQNKPRFQNNGQRHLARCAKTLIYKLQYFIQNNHKMQQLPSICTINIKINRLYAYLFLTSLESAWEFILKQ